MLRTGDASYLEEYRIDVSKLEPLVAAPHSPDNRKTAHECAGTKIDRVYIGCGIRLHGKQNLVLANEVLCVNFTGAAFQQ